MMHPRIVNNPTVPRGANLYGLGALRVIPTWCDSVPFSSFMDACQPYTQQELANDAASNAALINHNCTGPNCAQQTQQTADEIIAAGKAAQASDPYGTCVYNQTQTNSFWSSLVGPGAFCNPDGTPTNNPLGNLPVYLLIGGIATVLFLTRR